MKLNEYQEMQDIIVTIERLVSHINEELNKFPTDFVENHLEKNIHFRRRCSILCG